MHGEFTQTRVWERFYVVISRINRGFAAPKSESLTRIKLYRARKRHSTARLQTDARPPRNGSEQFGSGTQAYMYPSSRFWRNK